MAAEDSDGPRATGPDAVLVVTAHPDDVDFGAAGTVATWVEAGAAVTYCIVTDGDAGGFDPAVPRSAIGGIRRAEQTAAAAEVGVRDVRFLGYKDGLVVNSPDLVRDLSRVIRQVRPDVVLTQSPERHYTRMAASHPDHRAVGAAALDAVYPAARNPFAFPELLADEGLVDWAVPKVWLMGHPSTTDYVDVTAVFDRKLAALRRHESQIVNVPDLEGLLRSWLGGNAADAGLPEGRLAEGFFVLTV